VECKTPSVEKDCDGDSMHHMKFNLIKIQISPIPLRTQSMCEIRDLYFNEIA
jgi:hypothetical protein